MNTKRILKNTDTDYISIFLKKYGAMTKEELTEKRYDRFRRM